MNRERKLQQTSAGADLAALEARWHRLVLKNAEIEVSCPPPPLLPFSCRSCARVLRRPLAGCCRALQGTPQGACAGDDPPRAPASVLPRRQRVGEFQWGQRASGARSSVCRPASLLSAKDHGWERRRTLPAPRWTRDGSVLHLIVQPPARATQSRISHLAPLLETVGPCLSEFQIHQSCVWCTLLCPVSGTTTTCSSNMSTTSRGGMLWNALHRQWPPADAAADLSCERRSVLAADMACPAACPGELLCNTLCSGRASSWRQR